MVKRFHNSPYELCLEIWHTVDADGEVVIHHKEVYRRDGAKVKRMTVPLNVLASFDREADSAWWDYVDKLDY